MYNGTNVLCFLLLHTGENVIPRLPESKNGCILWSRKCFRYICSKLQIFPILTNKHIQWLDFQIVSTKLKFIKVSGTPRTLSLPGASTYIPYKPFLQCVVLLYGQTYRCLWHLPPCWSNGLAPRLWTRAVNNEMGPSIVYHRGVLFGWCFWEMQPGFSADIHSVSLVSSKCSIFKSKY